MQGVVNHLGHFTNVYVGWPGWVHDARDFANSALYVQGQEDRCSSPTMEHPNPAYPVLPWLMKAFPDNGQLT